MANLFCGDKNPFSPAFCSALLRFFWICYRHGLEDSAGSGDVGECEEAVERLNDVRRFGTVRCEMDWTEWQFKSLQWTRDDICRARTMDLIMALRRPSHRLGFLMQIAKMYYARGVRDWMQCCDWLTLEMIAEMPNYPYLLKRAKSFRPSQLRERFEFLQTECLNLISLHDAQSDVSGEYLVTASCFRLFVERVWAAMQRPKWFDDYDVETDRWDSVNPTKGVRTAKITGSDYYTEKNKGNARKNNRQKTDRRVSRKDTGRRDVSADGGVLQSGTPKRRRGRPPKNV